MFSTKTRADLAPQRWPFDQDFHLLLNMAVGGTLGGAVTPGIFPATMKVDYVRVYDGNKASIIGDRFLSSANRTGTFSILNVDPSTTVTWSAPAGVTINSGQGTSSVNLSWIPQGGILTAQVDLPCGSQTMSIEIAAGVSKSGSIENFDATGLGTLSFNSGVLTEVPNPASDAVNSSATVGKYVRDASTQYDVLQYDVNSMGNVNDFVTGQRQLFMDIYSTAPAGTIILAQLETRNATSSNYPSGRHSRYQAETTSASGWQRLQLAFLDKPDASANANSITKIPVLFEPGVSSGKTFYFDNFDIYSTAPVVSTRSLNDDNFSLSLLQNPVTNSATVDISLKETENLRLQLINSSGQEIQTLNLGTRSPGQHVVLLETASLSVGTYSITLLAGGRMVGSTLMVKQ